MLAMTIKSQSRSLAAGFASSRMEIEECWYAE